MILLKLTLRSLWNRRISLFLTILSIAVSIMLLLGVEYIRKEGAKFSQYYFGHGYGCGRSPWAGSVIVV